jgi:serine phosphatase RsbU (regulator of sigma subunit)
MDLSLCEYNPITKQLQYAGANNPLWIVREDIEGVELIEVKADKQPIGNFEFRKPFTNHIIQLQEGDCVYMFTDGYADQFGGTNGKKLMTKRFKEVLLGIQNQDMLMQHKSLDFEITEWMGSTYEQVDDILVIV